MYHILSDSFFILGPLKAMEEALSQAHGTMLRVTKSGNVAGSSELKLDTDGLPKNELSNEAKSTTSTQTAHLNLSTRRNLIQATINDNKENILSNETLMSFGVSHLAPDPCLTYQSREEVDAIDHYTTSTCPPLMSYTNSLAFSDISVPFPCLEASKSFGPSGIFQCDNYRNASNIATTAHFQCHSTLGQQECNLHTPNNLRTNHMRKVQSNHEDSGDGTTINDLNIVASALLELTPATSQNDRFYHAPLQIKNDHHVSRNEQRYTRQNVPLFRHNVSLDGPANTDEKSYLNLKFPTRARIEGRAQDLLNDVPYTVQACKCKNTKCLKLYCTCFQQGTLCDELVCYCRKCENTAMHSMPRGSRTRAIYEILNRRIDAFEPRERKQTGKGCSCRKSK